MAGVLDDIWKADMCNMILKCKLFNTACTVDPGFCVNTIATNSQAELVKLRVKSTKVHFSLHR
jgi:hypothetical protein